MQAALSRCGWVTLAAALLGALPLSSSWTGSFQLPRGAPSHELGELRHKELLILSTVAPGCTLDHPGFIPKPFLSAVCSHWCPQHGNILCMSCLRLGLSIPMEAGLAVPKHTWPPLLSPSSHTGEIKDIFHRGPKDRGVWAGSSNVCWSVSPSQDNHKLYKQKLEELTKLQDGISSSIARQKKRLKELSLSLKKCRAQASPEQEASIQETQSLIKERQNVFFEMEAYLPKKNGLYLSLVLGNVNVTLLSKQAKFAYKDEYEKFKLYLTIILLIVSFSCRFLLNSRVTDAVFNFLLVWYYCTLTIRESILINNGSKIKGWWVFHHYISTFLSGVMLTWPDGLMYQMFRNQFLSFSMYQSFVQFLQYYYQSGCLYRLRALGERHNMDLTVEGFQSWMWRGLTFLLPFLFFGQFWQLYNAITLFRMLQHPECKEWQVLMCGLPFSILFLGNFFTTLRVVHQKIQNKNQDTKEN
uniref:Transmembrane protein 120A n=1 Tax=Zonotrichia albicollis TaxID=44394 RepID=A0A8D2MTU4_ZONAL